MGKRGLDIQKIHINKMYNKYMLIFERKKLEKPPKFGGFSSPAGKLDLIFIDTAQN